MKKKDITAYKLCKDTGLPKNTIDNWKNGSIPKIDKFKIVSLYLGVSPNELLGIENNTELTLEEAEIINAYKTAPEAIKVATRKLLDIPDTGKSSNSKIG